MIRSLIEALPPDEAGVSNVESAILATLIAVVCLAITQVGNNLNLLYLLVCDEVANATSGSC